MDFMFEWQELYRKTNVSGHFPNISEHFPKITEDCRGRPKKIRICFDHTSTNSANSTKAKAGNRDVIERYDTRKGVIRKISHSGPGSSGVWNLRVV